jgi:CDP-diacylglycerol--glycerol-3-phosphate 3-phosphatidyltransferase
MPGTDCNNIHGNIPDFARFYGNTTQFGAVFDILADLFFISTSYIVLCLFRILPVWFLFIMLFKFIEFTVTSIFLKIHTGGKPVFAFDFIGRFAAVLFYLIPLSAYLFFLLSPFLYFFIIKYLVYIIAFAAIISSSYRIRNCVDARHNYADRYLSADRTR